jgi:hypothetical protein
VRLKPRKMSRDTMQCCKSSKRPHAAASHFRHTSIVGTELPAGCRCYRWCINQTLSVLISSRGVPEGRISTAVQ